MRINTPKFHTQREQAKNVQFTPKTLITERADTVIKRIRKHPLNEYLVHRADPGGDHRAQLAPVGHLGHTGPKGQVSGMISAAATTRF